MHRKPTQRIFGEVYPSLPKPEDQPQRVFGIKYPNTIYQFVVLCLKQGS